MKQEDNIQKVIDGDNMKIVETFKACDTKRILQKYENLGVYADVGVDIDGDIVLYKNLD